MTSKFIMYIHIIIYISIWAIPILTEPIPRLEWSEYGKLQNAMNNFIVNKQITLDNFVKALKKCGSKYDDFRNKWIISKCEGNRMLNVEPLLSLATDNYGGQQIKKIATTFKALDSNNDVCAIPTFANPISSSELNEYVQLQYAMDDYIVNKQITLDNFIKALEKCGSKYDDFKNKWIKSGPTDERLLNVEPLLSLATDNYEGQLKKKIATTFNALDSNNDGKIAVLDGCILCLLCNIPLIKYLRFTHIDRASLDFLVEKNIIKIGDNGRFALRQDMNK
ncbi:uncharacterized protein LOC126901786 [Daktulosphaira vitifoliae]|uniref:uncharacterized protein LOC126901786 n=1 Tax=Daktulosphaira vitifoliae TaxID=58002 RepID=UPI0021AA7EE1|nr:uncharacterized protein LOC126901786 [Daktulosphaira vitifoliae]